MNINDLTLGQVKDLVKIAKSLGSLSENLNKTLNDQIGEKVIVRTYSAGVWFGELEQKEGNEVYLKNARRMWKWWAAKSISLSGVAQYGIKQHESKITPSVKRVWLEAVEIITITEVAIKSIEGCPDVNAE